MRGEETRKSVTGPEATFCFGSTFSSQNRRAILSLRRKYASSLRQIKPKASSLLPVWSRTIRFPEKGIKTDEAMSQDLLARESICSVPHIEHSRAPPRLSALGACERETSIFVTDDATRNERDRCVVSSIRITILDFATIVCMEALPPSVSKRSHQCAMRPVIMTLWLRLQVLYCGGIHISRDERTNLIQQGKRGEWP